MACHVANHVRLGHDEGVRQLRGAQHGVQQVVGQVGNEAEVGAKQGLGNKPNPHNELVRVQVNQLVCQGNQDGQR